MKRFTFLHWSRPGYRSRQGLNLGTILIGVIWSLSITVASVMLAGFWVIFSSQETFYMADFISIVTLISTAVGGGISGRLAGNLGWAHGISVGLIYSFLVLCFTFFTSPLGLFIIPIVSKIIFLLIAGILGGVLGVNLSLRRRVYRRLPY